MDAIIGFLSGIGDLFVGAADFLFGLLADLVYLARLTARAVSAVPGLFRLLPDGCVAVLVTIFGVVVIYKLLGREG